MKPLYIYVSASCLACSRTYKLVGEVRALRPSYPIEIVDLDQPDAVRPAVVFGTPTYMLGTRVVSFGNPALQTLIDLLDAEANRVAAASIFG